MHPPEHTRTMHFHTYQDVLDSTAIIRMY